MDFSRAVGSGVKGKLSGFDAYRASNDATLFSSSLPVLPHEKLTLNSVENDHQSMEDYDVFEDIKEYVGRFLPNEDELLAGVMNGFDVNSFPNRVDESEEIDLFGSGGGMELESDMIDDLNMGMSKVNLGDGVVANGAAQVNLPNGVGVVAGEHPYGEHPSRTLFVRNINNNVEDSELRTLFEQYGDIRTLYTACKHRGFVMISYYDIRAARTAMRALQNKLLRRRKLDIHYSIPKDNPSDKDMNQGTLVVFNLDPSVSGADLFQIFGAYGEIKEIRETPHKRNHKFVEYYDVRATEAALRSLNRSDIAGKRIKVEPGRPGGVRRNLMLQSSQEFEQDDGRSFRLQLGSSIASSPPGAWPQFGSPIEHSPLQSPVFTSLSPADGNNIPGLASILHPQPARIPPIGKDHEHKLSGAMSSFGASSSTTPGIETLSGPQFLWGSPKIYSEQAKGPTHGFPTTIQSPTMGHPFATSNGLTTHGFSIPGQPGPFLGPSQYHHHVGSAPSQIPFDQHFGRYHDSPETLFMSPPTYGGLGSGQIDRGFLNPRGPINFMENGSPSFSNLSYPRMSPLFLGVDRGRNHRADHNTNPNDNKKQFQLDLEKIISGEDARTTLMIKNIPNKYTSKMLLATINENHSSTYDFLYLPIDFKNKCNVGYAFINMLSPMHIVPFYQAFNGKKWEKFNSEKVASLAYARIQGKAALVAHFQNSSLMNEDKGCRPILFHSEGSEFLNQESLQFSSLNIQVHSNSGESTASPANDAKQ